MKKIIFPTALSVILLLSISSLALAQVSGSECYPSEFQGKVYVNGNPAPAGLEITANVDGQPATITVFGQTSTITTDGKYGYSPYPVIIFDPDQNCENAHIIEFFIEGKSAGTYPFRGDVYTVTDLTVTGIQWCGDGSCNNGENSGTCLSDCPVSTDGGGGGNDGGGGGSYTPPVCTPDWECSPWSQCIDGDQERTCLDLDECDTEEGKPEESQKCGLEALLPENCIQGSTSCVGSTLFECGSESTWTVTETCENGCEEGSCLEEKPIEEGGSPITGLLIGEIVSAYGWIILVLVLILGAGIWRMRK